jgi:hypothetical protein
MELQGDVGQLEAHYCLYGDSANLDARYVSIYAKQAIAEEIVADGTPR